MKKTCLLSIAVCMSISSFASADTFGTGANQFEIEFVTISGDAGDLGNWSAGNGYTFSGVNHGDYRIGIFEITNEQWYKFETAGGCVSGGEPWAYNDRPYWNLNATATNNVSWYEAAQFVNWLNTSTGHSPAYKFSGTDHTFSIWDITENGYDESNPYRNKNAYYFLPTEDEWVKAAYWSGDKLQTWATVGDTIPAAGVDTNYNAVIGYPWHPGSGSEELNGTYDMMGNVLEWTESPYVFGEYTANAERNLHGGTYQYYEFYLSSSSDRFSRDPITEWFDIGFRVASVPEPATVLLLAVGGLALFRKCK